MLVKLRPAEWEPDSQVDLPTLVPPLPLTFRSSTLQSVMAARRKTTDTAAPARTLEAQLWEAADKMRGAVPPTDYMHVCLGLVFLRYLSAAFERKHAELLDTPHADAEDHEEYQADNVFWVPLEARWTTLQGHARSADVGKRLDDAMRAIEREIGRAHV